jgi:hypothetical protein
MRLGKPAIGAVTVGAVLTAGSLALAGSTTPNTGDFVLGNAGGLRYSSESRLADSGEAQAGCGPRTRRLIGGGGILSGPPGDIQLKAMSFRDWAVEPPDPNPDPDTDPDDGWGVHGVGPPGTATTGIAICRKGGRIAYRQTMIPVNSSDVAAGKLSCGGRRWQVTGGATFVGTAGGWINSSHPYDGGDRDKAPDDGWQIRAFAPVPSELNAFAICVRNMDLIYKTRRPVTIPDGNPESQTRSLNLSCGKKHHIVGGGLRLTGQANRAWAEGTAPVDSGDPGDAPDDRWRAIATNGGGVAITMKPFAICLR